MEKKPRLLIVSTNPPMNEMGGCLLLYRQFVLRDDFEVRVITDRSDYECSGISWRLARHPAIVSRLQRTRLSLWAHDWVHLFGGKFGYKDLRKFARDFNPDFVFVGPETWICNLGFKIAGDLKVPVIGLFMDWPVFASLAHTFVKKRFSHLYRQRYKQCDLAFGIAPEMLEALGPHPRARVLYPAGYRKADQEKVTPSRKSNDPILFFAGNLGQWYGQAVDQLIGEFRKAPSFRFRVAGTNGPWSPKEEEQLKAEGTFLGFLKGEAYNNALEEADALLVIMGFDPEDKIVESTNFKSKIVDYLLAETPLIIWGPEYCTAVTHALREGFAEVVTVQDPKLVLQKFTALASQPDRRAQLVAKGKAFFDKHLDAEKVYPEAALEMHSLIESK
jgi:hypothetical protein